MSSGPNNPLMCVFFGWLLALAFPAPGAPSRSAEPATVEANLHGLAITLDADSGSLLRLSYPEVGTMLEAKTDRASILDLAVPIEKFEPLRLASRFSHGAQIHVAPSSVTIHWDRLGKSRGEWAAIDGDVGATVTLKAADDGQSIIMQCEVDNRSKTDVRQVVFPDFAGLLPFAGPSNTTFRASTFGIKPFETLAATEENRTWHYVQPTSSYTVQYSAGGLQRTDMAARWMDFGSLKGGFSLFPRRWGWDPQIPLMLEHSEVEEKLRLMYLHSTAIHSGEKWASGEFWLTPHTGGWAKGIEPYRAYAQPHFHRDYAVPQHVREGLGFRTIFMSQYQPNDPQDAIYRFSDLPGLARESKEHGLTELVFWCFRDELLRPMAKPYSNIGTEQDLADAVAACRKLGVNAVPFTANGQVGPAAAERYGLHVEGGYAYHSELIPRIGCDYATQLASVWAAGAGEKWAEDVLEGCRHLTDIGVPSVCFDQYSATPTPPNMNTLTPIIRAYAKKRDPESTFSGEELWNWEIDCNYLDYTWNWGPYVGKDFRPLTSVYPAPRINYCIDSSPLAVKRAFADNLYLCIMPRKPAFPGLPNGSDAITNHAALSQALKQCAALRARFLHYFTDGKLIGECILTKPCAAQVTAYVLPDRLLMILVNSGGGTSQFDCDLSPWLNSPSGRYRVTVVGEDGKSARAPAVIAGAWHGRTGRLARDAMQLFEFTPE